MYIDTQGSTVQGLATAFLVFLFFIALMRFGTRLTGFLRFVMFFFGWLTLTSTATFRGVGDGKGGGNDAAVYRQHFESSEGAAGRTISASGTGAANEPLHLGLMQLLRLATDDYHLYFFAAHGIITFGIVFFIAKTLRAEHPILPLLLIFPSWLYSLSAMRNWMAIALLLVALTFFMRKRTLGFYVWALIAAGFHLSAALFLIFPIVAVIVTKQRSLPRKLIVVIAINLLVLGSSTIVARVLSGTRYEQYLSWEEGNILFAAPLLAIALTALVFVMPSDEPEEADKRIAVFVVFAAGLTTLIIYFGGFRYLTYSIVPQAVVSSYALYALRSRFASNRLARGAVTIAVYLALYLEADANLRSVVNLSGVFPLGWGPD